MVKSGPSKSIRVQKSTSSKSTPETKKFQDSMTTPETSSFEDNQECENLVWSLNNEDIVKVEDNDCIVIVASEEEILYDDNDTVYDNDEARTFIIRNMGVVEERVIKSATTQKTELVLNVDIVSPIGTERVLVIWGPPAVLVAEYLKYATMKITYPNAT